MEYKENMKISVAFTLDSIEQITRFFRILQIYWMEPERSHLEEIIKELEEKKTKLYAELEELAKKKKDLLNEISKLEAQFTNKSSK